MRPDFVVVSSPAFNGPSCIVEVTEPVKVQALVPEFAVEAFYEGILGRLPGLNEVQPNTGILRPEEHGLAGERWAVVTDDRTRQTMVLGQIVQIPHDSRPENRHIDDLPDTLQLTSFVAGLLPGSVLRSSA